MQQQHIAILTKLKDKIELLKRLFESELSKNKQFKEEISELSHKLKDQNLLNNKLQAENKALKFSLSLVSSDNAKEAKDRINKIVREIDKCIALLNK